MTCSGSKTIPMGTTLSTSPRCRRSSSSATPTLPTAIPAFLKVPITLSSQIGISNNVWNYLGQDKKNVAPRFGFAYQAFPNTVVRGAFGIYYNLIPASYAGGAFGTLPFVRFPNVYTACWLSSFHHHERSVLGHWSVRGKSCCNRAARHRDSLYRAIQPRHRTSIQQRSGYSHRLRRSAQR